MDPVTTRAGQSSFKLSSNLSNRQHLFPQEELDILVLNKLVQPLYEPRASPVAMIVGYSSLREAEILRGFHEDSYGFAHSTLKVAGCNIAERRAAGTTDSIDRLYMGHFAGDARDNFTWLRALPELGLRNQISFDMTYIRNPDLYDTGDWGAVFARAIEMTASSGVVVTLVRQDDVGSFTRLADYLARTYKMRPALVTETEMNLEDDPLRQHFLLGVFQGRGE
jgi:hypothetical protein